MFMMTEKMITLNNGVEMPILGFGVYQIPKETGSEGGISKWQAKDKEETRSIEFYTQENPSEPMESISTSTW